MYKDEIEILNQEQKNEDTEDQISEIPEEEDKPNSVSHAEITTGQKQGLVEIQIPKKSPDVISEITEVKEQQFDTRQDTSPREEVQIDVEVMSLKDVKDIKNEITEVTEHIETTDVKEILEDQQPNDIKSKETFKQTIELKPEISDHPLEISYFETVTEKPIDKSELEIQVSVPTQETTVKTDIIEIKEEVINTEITTELEEQPEEVTSTETFKEEIEITPESKPSDTTEVSTIALTIDEDKVVEEEKPVADKPKEEVTETTELETPKAEEIMIELTTEEKTEKEIESDVETPAPTAETVVERDVTEIKEDVIKTDDENIPEIETSSLEHYAESFIKDLIDSVILQEVGSSKFVQEYHETSNIVPDINLPQLAETKLDDIIMKEASAEVIDEYDTEDFIEKQEQEAKEKIETVTDIPTITDENIIESSDADLTEISQETEDVTCLAEKFVDKIFQEALKDATIPSKVSETDEHTDDIEINEDTSQSEVLSITPSTHPKDITEVEIVDVSEEKSYQDDVEKKVEIQMEETAGQIPNVQTTEKVIDEEDKPKIIDVSIEREDKEKPGEMLETSIEVCRDEKPEEKSEVSEIVLNISEDEQPQDTVESSLDVLPKSEYEEVELTLDVSKETSETLFDISLQKKEKDTVDLEITPEDSQELYETTLEIKDKEKPFDAVEITVEKKPHETVQTEEKDDKIPQELETAVELASTDKSKPVETTIELTEKEKPKDVVESSIEVVCEEKPETIEVTLSDKSIEVKKPVISKSLTNISITELHQIKFVVEFQCYSKPKVTWFLDDSPIEDSPELHIVEEEFRSELIIPEVLPEDEGDYKVVVEDEFGRCESTAYLTVLPTESKEVTVTETEEKPFQDEKTQETVDLHPKEQDELITVETERPTSEDITEVTTQTIDEKPKERPGVTEAPRFIQTLQRQIVVKERTTITIECSVVGSPTPTITWYQDEEEISPDDHFTTEYHQGVCRLIINNIYLEDEAEYKCTAENPHGTCNTITEIFVEKTENQEILLHEGFYSVEVQMEIQWKKTELRTAPTKPEP